MSKNRFQEAREKNFDKGLVKVGVPHSGGNEWLWCKPLDTGLLQVRNTPFFVEEPCLDDVIEVTGEGPYYMFDKVVEHIREPVFMEYEHEMTKEELQSRFSTFCNACREHNLHPEGCVTGYVVVAIPWATKEVSLQRILEIAKTANLEMWEYEE